MKRYDGSHESLRFCSTKPHFHKNQHTLEELLLIKRVASRFKLEGCAEVYVQLIKREYKRSYGSLCLQLRKFQVILKRKAMNKLYRRHPEVRDEFPGDKVQVDIKYVPNECIGFDS